MRSSGKGTLAGVLLASIVLHLVGCGTFRDMPDPTKWATDLQEGDRVRVTTVSGVVHDLVIVSVTPDSLVGEHVQLPLGDIRRLERREVDTSKTVDAALWTVAGAGALLLVLIAVAVLSLSS